MFELPKYSNEKIKRSTPVLLIVRESKDKDVQSLIGSFLDNLLNAFSKFNDNSLDTFLEVALMKYDDTSLYYNEEFVEPYQVHDSLKKSVVSDTLSTRFLISFVKKRFQCGQMLSKDSIIFAPICLMLNINNIASVEEAKAMADCLKSNRLWKYSKKISFLFDSEKEYLFPYLIHREDAIFHISVNISQQSIDEISNIILGVWGNAIDMESEYDGDSRHGIAMYGPEPLSGYDQGLKVLSELLIQECENNTLTKNNTTHKIEYDYQSNVQYTISMLQHYVSDEFIKIIIEMVLPNNGERSIVNDTLDEFIFTELDNLYNSHIIYKYSINSLKSSVLFVLDNGSIILLSTNGIWLIDSNVCISEGDITITDVKWDTELAKDQYLEYNYWDIVNEARQHCIVNYNDKNSIDIKKDEWIYPEW